MAIFSNSGGWWEGRLTAGHRQAWVAADGGGLRVRVSLWLGFRVPGWGVFSIAARPRGRFGGGCQTDGGGGVWAERWAAAAPPAGVVEEAGWAGSAAEVRNQRWGGRWRRIWWQ
jgi:hypothetical protein